MPDIWMDVDAAITIPVNKVPLVSSSDFVTIDETIAYNEAGMDLNWNFATTAGVVTQTNVVPTTAGDYDWTHGGNGMYKIEMTASGGISANNDTEGVGWFSGVCSGVLPFVGPFIGFRAAALNNALIDGGDVLDVSLTEIGGVAQSATDLKDFVDTGYDPAAHKVQGVVLVDTVTAMAGTITTLDALDTAQDSQHSTTQSAITNLLAKVLAYFQLALRSDAAIATDNATELGEINANEGSGVGDWDNTTDSEEAQRDWIGDGTNLTEAGGTGDHLTAIDLPNQTMDITGNLSGSVGSVTGGINTSGGTITTLDALDTAQDSQHSTTQAAVAALNNLSAAQVNAEVVDVIRTDTASELAAVPAASPNLHAMVQWIYMRFRNKETSNSSAATVANDAGTTIGTSAVTDSAGTLTKSKYS